MRRALKSDPDRWVRISAPNTQIFDVLGDYGAVLDCITRLSCWRKVRKSVLKVNSTEMRCRSRHMENSQICQIEQVLRWHILLSDMLSAVERMWSVQKVLPSLAKPTPANHRVSGSTIRQLIGRKHNSLTTYLYCNYYRYQPTHSDIV